MKEIKDLHEVMVTEAQLAEGLAAVLQEQQDAMIGSIPGDLEVLLQKSEGLLQPIATLEAERERLTEAILLEKKKSSKGAQATSQELLGCMGEGDAVLMRPVVERLRAASKEVLRINNMNKPLLQHSQRFVRQTLRAATDDYKKNLIDKRM